MTMRYRIQPRHSEARFASWETTMLDYLSAWLPRVPKPRKRYVLLNRPSTVLLDAYCCTPFLCRATHKSMEGSPRTAALTSGLWHLTDLAGLGRGAISLIDGTEAKRCIITAAAVLRSICSCGKQHSSTDLTWILRSLGHLVHERYF
jgi:hypothetical protein